MPIDGATLVLPCWFGRGDVVVPLEEPYYLSENGTDTTVSVSHQRLRCGYSGLKVEPKSISHSCIFSLSL